MPSACRANVNKLELAPALSERASRRRALRILFVHNDTSDVENCVQELKKAYSEVKADVVLTPEQFAGRLDPNLYDVVLAKYPMADWGRTQALEILNLEDRQIPLIFLTGTTRLETVA
jgi:DNA-binding NtrC family response regulator